MGNQREKPCFRTVNNLFTIVQIRSAVSYALGEAHCLIDPTRHPHRSSLNGFTLIGRSLFITCYISRITRPFHRAG